MGVHQTEPPGNPSFLAAPIPDDEEERMQELRLLRILDTPPDPKFDAITQTAQRAIGVPIVLISIIDENRQWFKSACGLDVPETGRDISFCGHAIVAGQEIFVVEDAKADPRFAENPLVTGDLHLRFYAGAPLRGPGGAMLGTLCLIDREPRKLSDDDRRVMLGLKRWAESELILNAMGHESLTDWADLAGDAVVSLDRSRFWDIAQDIQCIADVDGYFKDMNPRLSQVLGLTKEQLMARPFYDFIHPDDQQATGAEVEKLAKGLPTVSFRNRLRARDGSYHWLDWTATPSNGKLYATARDVTAAVVQAEILESTQEELLERNDELQQFTSIASHDLQEPLRKLVAFSDRLEERLGDQADEKTRLYLDRMRLAAERMRNFIQALLALSRVTSRPAEPKAVDTAAVMAAVLDDLKESIDTTGATIAVGLLPPVTADPIQLHQLFQNFLSNAIKYQPVGQVPKVTVQGIVRGPRVEFTVADNGIGFDAEYSNQIFKPFQRLHSGDQYQGTGMGLAICKKIVEVHGGKLTANGDAGATFTFDLPGAPHE